MRNLKRVLSLTLASIMLLGMMVIGTSAASDYSDVDYDNDNVEAIEVLQAINVMSGDLDSNGNLAGTFRPGDEVSRAEMARIMAALMDLDYDYYVGVNPFTDMVGHWAEGYAAACAANGIIAGRTNTTYDPSATVTAVEAAAMLMRALGYFQNWAVDYADGFEISTVRQAGRINLFNKVDVKTNEPMTRNDVAQLILNTLQSGMVEPNENAKVEVTVGDAQVSIGSSNYVYVVSRDVNVGNAINTDRANSGSGADGLTGPVLDLGEKLYNGKLKLSGEIRNQIQSASDVFYRPSRTWEYDGKEIGTYMKTENIRETYTAAVSNRTLYDLLGRNALEEYTVNYYVDGVQTGDPVDVANEILSRTADDFGATDKGVLTQIFVDTEQSLIDITSIHTYLAQSAVDYNKSTESVTLTIFSGYNSTSKETLTTNKTVGLADVPAIEGLAQDDYIRVNVSGKNGTNLNPATLSGYDVVVVEDVEILTDSTLTKFSKGSNRDTSSNSNEAFFSSVVSDGTEYKASAFAYYSDSVLDLYDNSLLVNHTYNIYLDKYGYALGIDLYSGDDNYVFITGFDTTTSNIALGSATAAAIFTDGTMGTIRVNVRDTNKNIDKVAGKDGSEYFEEWSGATGGMTTKQWTLNRWYTYTVDANNEYTLNPALRMFTTEVVNDTDEALIRCDNVRIDEYAADVPENGTDNGLTGADRVVAAGSTTRRAYGNDDSIYIVVDTEEKADSSDNNIITDVAGVYTGVQSVEIEVTGKARHFDAALNTAEGLDADYSKYLNNDGDDTDLYDSIYTLYDKNNYIIAAVIIGEAKGSDANLVYILTAAKSEELLGDGSHEWVFDAVVDGKIQTLKTNSKFRVINDLEPGHVQELRYNGEYVTGVKTPTDLDDYWTKDKAFGITKIDDEIIVDIGHDPLKNANSDCWNGGPMTLDDGNASRVGTYTSGGTTWFWGSDGTGGTTAVSKGHLTADEAADLRVEGRTLYLAGKTAGILGADRGLALVENAPAVILHTVDDSAKKIECDSVAQAVAELGDADDNPTNGKQFAGRIVAVLDSQGRAKWVVFISDTKITTASGGSATGGSGTGVESDTPVYTVNALMNSSNRNVTIDGDWEPSDTYTTSFGSKTPLNIPAGRTLTIKGNFTAGNNSYNRVEITGGGTLVVEGVFTTDSNVSDDVTYAVKASAINLYTSAPVVFNNTVETTYGNLILNGTATNKVTFNGKTTIAGNLVSASAGARVVDVNGTLTAKNIPGVAGGGTTLTVNVKSVNSLKIDDEVGANVTVDVGASGTANGYAKIGTLKGELIVNNKTASTKTSEVDKAAKDSTLDIQSGTLTVTSEIGTNDITIAEDQTLEFGAKAKAVDDAQGVFVDTEGLPINDLGGARVTAPAGGYASGDTITVEGGTGSSLLSDDGVISSDANIDQVQQVLESVGNAGGGELEIEDLDTGDDDLEIPADTSLTVTGTAAGKITATGTGAIEFENKAGVKAGEELDLSEIDNVTFGEEFNVPDDSTLILPDAELDELPKITGEGEIVFNGDTADADYATKLGRTATISGTAEGDGAAVEAKLPAAPKVSGTGELKEYTQEDGTDLEYFLEVNNASSLSIYTINLSTTDAPAGSTITLKKSKTGGDDSSYQVMVGGGKNEPDMWENAAVDDNANYRNIVLLVADTIHSIKIIITIDDEAYTYILTNPNWTATPAD